MFRSCASWRAHDPAQWPSAGVGSALGPDRASPPSVPVVGPIGAVGAVELAKGMPCRRAGAPCTCLPMRHTCPSAADPRQVVGSGLVDPVDPVAVEQLA